MPRVDIPAKVTGGVAYVQDLRLPGMVHARVVRPPSYARAPALGRHSRCRAHAGRAQGRARRQLPRRHRRARVSGGQGHGRARLRSRWDESQHACPIRPSSTTGCAARLRKTTSSTTAAPAVRLPSGRTFEAVYHRPYQLHGSIGPSCAVRACRGGRLTVWTHAQGVYPLRDALAEMLRLPQEQGALHPHGGLGLLRPQRRRRRRRRCRAARRGAPRPAGARAVDARAGARLGAFGAAMVTSVRASLDAGGAVADWQYEVWSNAHSTRPGGAGNLMPAWHLADAVHATGARADPAARPAAATATPFRSTALPTPASSITSSRRCRCASRRCARSAPT